MNIEILEIPKIQFYFKIISIFKNCFQILTNFKNELLVTQVFCPFVHVHLIDLKKPIIS